MRTFAQYLVEMARREGSDKPPIPIFDEDDQKYYKHIIDNAPDSVKGNENLLRLLVQQSICTRYGRKDAGGMLLTALEKDQDYIDKTFKITGHSPITIKGIPFFPQKMVEKFDNLGWDYLHPEFGYGKGPCSWKEMMGERAKQYIRFFADGVQPDDKHTKYHPRFTASAKVATAEDKLRHQQIKERGIKKREQPSSEFDEKLTEAIPLDRDDEQYLADIKKRYLEEEGGAGHMFRAAAGAALDKYILPQALAMRYSDRWVDQEEDGTFRVNDKFKTRDEPEGLLKGKVHVRGPQGTLIELPDIHLNLPALAKKFERYKLSRNFVKKPLAGDMGLQTASRWLQSKSHQPQQGIRYGDMKNDPAFYEQISKDHELWRTTEMQPVKTASADPSIAERLTWRKGNMIVEPPNIQDKYENRDPERFSWEELLRDDAKRAVNSALSLLGRTRFLKDPNFKTWAKQSDVNEDMITRALTELMVRKTGVMSYKGDKDAYRRESVRSRWASAAVEQYVDEIYAKRARGTTGDDDKTYDDPNVSKDDGDTVNTLATGSKRPEERDFLVPAPQEEPEEVSPKRASMSPEEWEGELARMQQSVPALPLVYDRAKMVPLGIKRSDWFMMSRDQKVAAMKRAGLA